ncbi:MAG: alpha/beta hydrolase [Acidimicrobiales bacterium]
MNPARRSWSRRRFLSAGLAGAAVVGGSAATLELVAHGVLPGTQLLDRLDGGCSVTHPPFAFAPLGPAISGTFYSVHRHRDVGYTLAFPPGHTPGTAIPLVLMLHGFGANHTDALSSMSPPQAVALRVDGVPPPPMALVTVDGGGGYWNPHPGDDPMSMVVDELIPRCRELGPGRPPSKIGTMGVSMGGFGALLFGEQFPDLISAVAAISPAIWTSYGQARAANPGAYASASAFAAYDAVTHASALAHTPVRVASGADDPFHPGVEALATALGPRATVDISKGCHTGAFFASQEPPSLAFLGRHLTS